MTSIILRLILIIPNFLLFFLQNGLTAYLFKEHLVVFRGVKIETLLLETFFKLIRKILLFLCHLLNIVRFIFIHHYWSQVYESFLNLCNNIPAFLVKLWSIEIYKIKKQNKNKTQSLYLL